jgi:hypothetical protein
MLKLDEGRLGHSYGVEGIVLVMVAINTTLLRSDVLGEGLPW